MKIKYIKDKDGQPILPVTSASAVIADDGKSVQEHVDSVEGFEKRVRTIEGLAQLNINSEDIPIATPEDMDDTTPEGRAKLPTMGVIQDVVGGVSGDVSDLKTQLGDYTLSYKTEAEMQQLIEDGDTDENTIYFVSEEEDEE